jgi:hypothetical protein
MRLKALGKASPKLEGWLEKHIIERFQEYDEFMANAKDEMIRDMWDQEKKGFRHAIVSFGFVITEDVEREAQ